MLASWLCSSVSVAGAPAVKGLVSSGHRAIAARSTAICTKRWSHDYSDTVMLPSTEFPDRTAAKKVQEQFLDVISDQVYKWQKDNLPEDGLFILHDGPPYANADVHVGHAVNRIIKDMIIRYQVMQGRRVSYIPGWDCHGLPIELKVLESLEDSTKVQQLTAIEIRKLARQHAENTISKQMRSFKEWGTMGEWESPYKTMNPDYEIRQLEVFRSMVNAGVIYRRFRPVYWSCQSHTALAEAELEYAPEHRSTATYVKFAFHTPDELVSLVQEQSGVDIVGKPVHALIWTTTPWTIPANKAIAVNPEMMYQVVSSDLHGVLVLAEPRAEYVADELGPLRVLAKGIPGLALTRFCYSHPLHSNPGTLPILAADFVTSDAGTGLVHCAPGHGMEDYLLCQKHGIQPSSSVNEYGEYDATVSAGLEVLIGKSVLKDGQSTVLRLLSEADALAGVNSGYKHKYPYDWRSKKPVIIRATAQWFADVGSIKDKAVSSLDSVHFLPEAGRHRLTSFTRERTEWCISRQRAWGVPIPALYDSKTGDALLTDTSITYIINQINKVGIDAWFAEEEDLTHWVAPEYREEGKTYIKGKDTMDVWFDSGTSWTLIQEKYGSLRETQKSLVDVYIEGSDQHRGWFQSSLLTYTATHRNGKAPFSTVLTHGFTLDGKGRKMSKSLGNVIAPGAITWQKFKIDKLMMQPIGVSGLRLWVAQNDYTTDISVSVESFKRVQDSLSKLRRTFKYILGNFKSTPYFTYESDVEYEELGPIDRYALYGLYELEKSVKAHYGRFAFNRVVQAVNKNVAELSSSYFQLIKSRLYTDHPSGLSRRAALTALAHIFRMYASILSPIVPLLTQEAWHHAPCSVTGHSKDVFSPFVAGWYKAPEEWNNEKLRADFSQLSQIRDAVNDGLEIARKSGSIGTSLDAGVVLVAEPGSDAFELLENYKAHLAEYFVTSEASVLSSTDSIAPTWHCGRQELTILGSKIHTVIVSPSRHKCPRCWHWSAQTESEICRDCEETVKAMGELNAI
ncbi:tRNA synthetases class I-domain-containing protein [Lipomyces tetrasporus]|uniref:Isoleucine--tRNA ligase, mitochondrial n=1 Tax=Lipomyces tetrasporus TaxID=54092 RepID=A0AAD7QP12_9ASCO|nr:tRNA synthetases class I-domain-containing protein [Lipomyces tetrasporus]KAJ8098854.1 tRNA synthetases class I-domain-containing protein [Lipomyces tetrasporus]